MPSPSATIAAIPSLSGDTPAAPPTGLHYSQRSREIVPLHVMALLARANELEHASHDVIHLEIGEPDFTTATPIVAAGQAALDAGHPRYTAARGSPALRRALANFYQQRHDIDLDPARILISPEVPVHSC